MGFTASVNVSFIIIYFLRVGSIFIARKGFSFSNKYLELLIRTQTIKIMDSFPKINSLIQEIYDELDALKKELENDVNYSANHADIVTSVESAEEMLHEFNIQMHNIESDVDTLDESIEEQQFDADYDDEDIIEKTMYNDYAEEDN
jgi:hypothetical protein